jgi:threonine/homoserine/homoserine lactone efflux protein
MEGMDGTFASVLPRTSSNPEIAVFYTTLLPRLIVPGDPVLLKSLPLAGIRNLVGLTCLTGYVWVVTRAPGVSAQTRCKSCPRPTHRGRPHRALGFRLAIEKR